MGIGEQRDAFEQLRKARQRAAELALRIAETRRHAERTHEEAERMFAEYQAAKLRRASSSGA